MFCLTDLVYVLTTVVLISETRGAQNANFYKTLLQNEMHLNISL